LGNAGENTPAADILPRLNQAGSGVGYSPVALSGVEGLRTAPRQRKHRKLTLDALFPWGVCQPQ
jgi:hypothetical protein